MFRTSRMNLHPGQIRLADPSLAARGEDTRGIDRGLSGRHIRDMPAFDCPESSILCC
jgi:hypothetical protein